MTFCRVSSGLYTKPEDRRSTIPLFQLMIDVELFSILIIIFVFFFFSLCSLLLFLACSKDLLLNNFILQLECKYIPSGPFS